jgi:hypothetical protein
VPPRRSGDDANQLAQQELAAHLASVIGGSTQVKGRDHDHCLLAAPHSSPGLSKT